MCRTTTRRCSSRSRRGDPDAEVSPARTRCSDHDCRHRADSVEVDPAGTGAVPRRPRRRPARPGARARRRGRDRTAGPGAAGPGSCRRGAPRWSGSSSRGGRLAAGSRCRRSLDEAWLAAVGWLASRRGAGQRLFVGGRSAGARVACRTALALGAARRRLPGASRCTCPAGRTGHGRAELLTAGVPRLVLQGTSDSFGTPDEIAAAIGRGDQGSGWCELPGADHGFRVAKNAGLTTAELRARVVDEVTGFLAGSRE